MDAAATICPNPTEGLFKYTVVTSGRPVVDGLHHGDLPVAADYLRKQGAEARLGKRQLAKLSCGMLPLLKSRAEPKVHGFRKPTIQPLDPTEMADYSPRTTTFINGRPSSASTPRHHPLSPTSVGMPGPSHASPDSIRDGSATNRDDPEDVASVDSAPGTMRYLHARARPDAPSSVPDALLNPRLALHRFPQDVASTSDEGLDVYLEQFFPELHSMSDAELLRLMDPTPSAPAAPAIPARSPTLAILQDMLHTQGPYAAATSAIPSSAAPKQQHAAPAASNAPSGNWSSVASDEQVSHSWSDTPSHNWRSPRSPSPGPAGWMSWPSTTTTQSRKRPRHDPADDLADWPALAEHIPMLSGDGPPSKRQMLHHPLPPQQHAAAAHDAAALDRQLLYSTMPSAAGPRALEAPTRPNPFACVSKQTLMQQPAAPLPRGHPLEVPSYLSVQRSASPHHLQRLGSSPTSGDSSSRGSSTDTIEPASVLEQALRDLHSKPEGQAC